MNMNDGRYRAVFLDAVLTEVGGRKTPAMSLRFDVREREGPEGWEPLSDGTVEAEVLVWLSDKAMTMAHRKLGRLGFDGNFENPTFSKVEDGVALECVNEEYDGKIRPKWDLEGWGARKKAQKTTLEHVTSDWEASKPDDPRQDALSDGGTPGDSSIPF